MSVLCTGFVCCPRSSSDEIHNKQWLIFFPSAELTATARSAAFFAGDVPGLPDAPPDFAGSDAEVAAGMAPMDSPFEPTQATFVEPLHGSA